MVTVGTTMAHTEDPPPPITPSAEPTADPMPPCAPPGDPTPCCGAQGSGSGMGPYPSPPPPRPTPAPYPVYTQAWPMGVSHPPPPGGQQHPQCHHVTEGRPTHTCSFPPSFGRHAAGGGRGLRFGRWGGGKLQTSPMRATSPTSHSSQRAAGRGCTALCGSGATGDACTNIPPPKTPLGAPQDGQPPPNPPLALPLHPTASGLAGNACPKLSAEQSRGQSAAPHPQSRRRPPPHVPPLGGGSVLTSPGAGGGPWAARCPPVLQP